MKKECKIVQDLLPNYLEQITNEETNKFIEEHIANCEECNKVYLAMKQDLKVNSIDTKEEIKYMKKFKTKLKILRNILIIIVAIYIIVIARKAFILTSLRNKSSKLYNRENYERVQIGERAWVPNDLNNYYYKTISTYNDGKVMLVESYRKDGKALATMKIYSVYENELYIKETMYSNGNDNLSFTEDYETNKITVREGNVIQGGVAQVPALSDGFWDEYFKFLLFSNIYESNLGGRACYVIKFDDKEQFVDKETGMFIKVVNNEYNIVTDYYYEFGIVTDEDVQKPEIPKE